MIMLLSMTGNPAHFAASAGRAMLAGADAVRTLLKRRRTYGSLSALDDRMLHDIGLHRSMLLGVAMHGVKSAREAAAPLAKAAAVEPPADAHGRDRPRPFRDGPAHRGGRAPPARDGARPVAAEGAVAERVRPTGRPLPLRLT